jgi:hypothetical protein
MTDYTLSNSDIDGLVAANSAIPPELRDDAAIISYGMIAQEAPASGSNITSHKKAKGGSGNAYSGLFQQTNSSFNWGMSQWSDKFQKQFSKNGWTGKSSVAGANVAALGHTHDAFKFAKDKEGVNPQLFHANWAQLGRGNFAELMRIKNEYPQHRLIDLKKGQNGAPKYKPKYNGDFWTHMQRQSNIRMDMTLPQNEEWMWSKYWKKNEIGTPARRTYPMKSFDAVMGK